MTPPDVDAPRADPQPQPQPSVRRALAWSLIERYLLLALALGSNVVLARLLTPNQIGVFSVSLAVIGVAQALRDFGVGSYLIQERNLNHQQIRTAFGISLLLGGVLFAATVLAAPAAAAYYAEPRMLVTLRISALNFLLLPFCTVSLALLRRDMLFQRLVHVSLLAALGGAAASIGLALAGVGENSQAIGAVLGNAITGVGAWLARPERRLLLPAFSEWRGVLKFGGQTSLTGFVTSVSMDANDLVVGKVLGFQPVAMLSRAQGLMNLFNRDLMQAVRNVALPAFAAAHRDGAPLQQPFARSVALVTVFAWPFHGLVSIYALEIVHLLFGPQWYPAAPLVPVFCLAGAIAAVNALTPNLLVAIGRIDLVTRVELMMQPLRLLMVIVAAVVFRTVEACAGAYLLSAAVSLPVFWWFKNQGLPDDARAIRRHLAKSALVTAATLAPALLHAAVAGFGRSEPIALPAWLAVCGAGVLCGLLAIRRLQHPLAGEPLYARLLAPVERWCARGAARLRG